ncbi:hypothetical protein ACI2L1_02990 [Streptomyces sp. NPDC019531]|uniref:hypothetical protein n=1 Tax=Streptomyces sp. NPDC019531 TaxID=3365062 RepID=UPI00384EE743
MTTATGFAPKRADELEHLLGAVADSADASGASGSDVLLASPDTPLTLWGGTA